MTACRPKENDNNVLHRTQTFAFADWESFSFIAFKSVPQITHMTPLMYRREIGVPLVIRRPTNEGEKIMVVIRR
jgi:hypothetical protein